MPEINTWSICSVTSTADSLKHTTKYGIHKPVHSPLLANELTNLFIEKVNLRQDDEFKLNPQNIRHDRIYFELLSQTSFALNNYEFRKIGAFINNEGLCKVVHLLNYSDIDRFSKKKNEIELFNETIKITFKK